MKSEHCSRCRVRKSIQRSMSTQAIENFVGEAADDLAPLPVRHAVDPDDQAAGGEATQVVVALQQNNIGSGLRGSVGCGTPGRSAAHHEDVALVIDGDVASWFAN